MRGARLILLLALLSAATAACGSSSASSPLRSTLSYFPKNSPFVVSIATGPNTSAVKGLQAMLRKIPLATFGQAALIAQLQQKGIDYDSDIRPLFGNPVMVGFAGSSGIGAARTNALIVWVTKDAGALTKVVKQLGFSSAGSHDGATLYRSSAGVAAVNGATLIGGSSMANVTAALDRHAAGQGMGASDFDGDLGSLPKDALVNVVGNVSGLLASPSAAQARAVPWVAALRSYGVAVSASSGGLAFQYTLNTTGASLSSSELPLTPGSSPPGLAGTLPIQFGLRQPAATLSFLLDAARRASPAKYAADLARMAAVKRRTGVDFRRDVLGEIGSSAAVESTGHGLTMARVDVVNPTAAARTLRKLGTSALDMLGSHPHSYITRGPAEFETVHTRGSRSVLFGLVGSEFVAGTASPAQLRAFAAAPAAAAPGAQGAAAFRIALPELVELATHGASSKTVEQVLSSLGDITGWISSSTSALTGSATLALK